MEAPDFIAAGKRLYGKHGWIIQLAEGLGMHRNTISKYAKGKLPIPLRIELSMRELERGK